MDKIILKKHRPVRAWYIGGSVATLGLLGWGNWDQVLILILIGISIIGFGSYYIITANYNNKVCYSFFGLTFFKKRIDILHPDYISIFNINQKRSNEYGPVSALGSVSKDAFFVIRFFKENEHFTLYKSKNYNETLEKGKAVSSMLKVELINKINS